MTDSRFACLARLSRRSLIAAGLTYAVGLVGHAAVRPLVGPRQGWLELADDLLPWAYLGGPPLLGFGVKLRSRQLTVAGAVICGAFGLRWGHRFLRSDTRPGRASADLTIMTFNTLAWKRGGDDLVASIRAANPDVVGLQEIGPAAIDRLIEVLGDRFPYRETVPSANSSGAAVLSRYPIRDARKFRHSERGHWWQSMTLDTPFGQIAYVNVHTKIPFVRAWRGPFAKLRIPRSFHSGRRRREIEALVEMLDAETRPTIVAGDFNMTERSADYAAVASRLRDAYRSVGRGLGHTFPRFGIQPRTFPAPWPALRLDYVWHSGHFRAVSAEVGNAGESDHHPVIVGLRWTQARSNTGRNLPLAAHAV
jgi:endonuclease/exonuclease/phosphatase family metal-dependent hydrolase